MSSTDRCAAGGPRVALSLSHCLADSSVVHVGGSLSCPAGSLLSLNVFPLACRAVLRSSLSCPSMALSCHSANARFVRSPLLLCHTVRSAPLSLCDCRPSMPLASPRRPVLSHCLAVISVLRVDGSLLPSHSPLATLRSAVPALYAGRCL